MFFRSGDGDLMSFRVIHNLKWARPAENPWPGIKRPRGLKAQGLRFQRTIGKVLPFADDGPWFEFCDANGPGYCQPDFVFSRRGELFVVECKLTHRPESELQATQLYRPVLEFVYKTPVKCIVAAKSLSHKSIGPVCCTLALAVLTANPKVTPIWHVPNHRWHHIPPDFGERPKVPVYSELKSA